MNTYTYNFQIVNFIKKKKNLYNHTFGGFYIFCSIMHARILK